MLPAGNWPSARCARASSTRDRVHRALARACRSRAAPARRRSAAAAMCAPTSAADQRGGEVLVDHRVHARPGRRPRGSPARRRRRRPPPPRRRPAARGSPRPRPPPAARARRTTRRQPRPESSATRPAAGVGQAPGAALGEEGPDRLGGSREGRIVGVDHDLGHHRRHRARAARRRPGRRRSPGRAGSRAGPGSSRPSTKSGCGGTSRATASWAIASAPTWGPLPCTTSSRCAVGQHRRRRSRRPSRARSSWSAKSPRPRGGEGVAADRQHHRLAQAPPSSRYRDRRPDTWVSGPCAAPPGRLGSYLPTAVGSPRARDGPARATTTREEQAWRRSRE